MTSKRHRMAVRAATAACVLGVTACGGIFEPVCTLELRSVIQLDILDSVTRAPAAADATVLLRGPFTDSLTVPGTSTSSVAHVWTDDKVKPGTYSLAVRKPGYRPWSQTGIQVEWDRCHSTTFDHATALLQP